MFQLVDGLSTQMQAIFEAVIPLLDLSFAYDINLEGQMNLQDGLSITKLLEKLEAISLLSVFGENENLMNVHNLSVLQSYMKIFLQVWER